MPKLNKEEREILEAYEGGKLKSVANVKEELQRYRAYAAATNSQDKRMNIRLSSKDLNALQARALREGIPHQALASSILHKYVEGQLVEAAKVPTKQIRAAK